MSWSLARLILRIGILAPVAALALAVAIHETARAATTDCGPKQTAISEGGNLLKTYFEVYADPDCAPYGNRYKAYDMYATSTYAISEIRVFFTRDWSCGTLWSSTSESAVLNSNWWNHWTGWTPQTTCGYQADIYARHTQNGSFQHYTYVNIDGQFLA